MRNNKKIALFFSLLITCSLFWGCNPTTSNQPEKVTIATSKNAWAALTIIAYKKGFFKEEGVEVNLEYVQAAKLAMDALLGGSAQLSNVVSTNVAFLGYTGNTEVEVVTTHCETHDGAIVARRDSNIKEPKDLEGKKLGVIQGTTSQVFADWFIEKYKLDASKIQIVNLTAVAMQSSVNNKEVDAGSLWQPFIYNIQKQLGDNAVVFADKDVYTGYMNIAVKKDWAKQHSKVIEAILRAHIKAEEFAKTNKDAAIETVAQEIGLDKALLAQIWDQYMYKVYLSPELLNVIKREGTWIKKSQPQFADKTVPSYDSAINNTFLKTVAQDRVQ